MAADERKVAFYQDSMHPWVKSDRPGKCTVCDMELTPIYQGQAGFGSSSNLVVLSSNQITVLNVQTEPVERRTLTRSLRVAGALEANETKKTIVSAPARGRIDELAVDYAGVEVEQGQKLITMFSPELVQLRKTLLAVRQVIQPGSTNSPAPRADPGAYAGEILAPQAGVVLERNVYNGQYVAEGDRLLTIVDASVLWFRFDVYQAQLPWFEPDQTIQVEVSGIPGKVFPAVISVVEPAFNDITRTVKVRADISNPLVDVKGHKRRLLKYGMYAEGQVRSEVTNILAIPRSAILFPGGTAYAYVDKGGGAFERRRLKLGRQGDAYWETLKGVEAGENVVTSGNMLIDAQAQFNLTSTEQGTDSEEPALVDSLAAVSMPDNMASMPEMSAARAPGSGRQIFVPSAQAAVEKASTPLPRQSAIPQGGGARTERMSAIMSPGSELQLVRRAAILKELEANGTNAPATAATIPSQRDVLLALVATTDGMSRALAADDVLKYTQLLTNQPNALLALPDQLGKDHRWAESAERLAAAAKIVPTGNLEAARKQFLPLSTAIVELVKQLRKEDPVFAELKIYHCPMAPEPGLWMQTKGPLANPFFGSKMLRCGEEVAP